MLLGAAAIEPICLFNAGGNSGHADPCVAAVNMTTAAPVQARRANGKSRLSPEQRLQNLY